VQPVADQAPCDKEDERSEQNRVDDERLASEIVPLWQMLPYYAAGLAAIVAITLLRAARFEP